ncbi:hypothetical protein COLO4_37540 [Corchorus olitorius]|uniref:Uncharacterized protein n=1 Tax=Corchorus olitorius TaxID=93759 RepID=A0A1R3G0V1_9ROSI|nr:hypothetical protein COLO4_37540 [Corchorus olitorius]
MDCFSVEIAGRSFVRFSSASKRLTALISTTVEAMILEVTALDLVRRLDAMVEGLFKFFAHLQLIPTAPNEGCVRWQASFGSDFEIGYHSWDLATLACTLGNTSNKYDILRRIVSKHSSRLQSIALSDSFESGMIFLGEEQIARSKKQARNGFN